MKKFLLSSILIVMATTAVFAQKKSELLAEIEILKTKLDSTENHVIQARKTEKIAVAKATSFESQVKDLQEANATLLKNLNSFAEVSSKNSSAINQALASLEQKENQLKFITNGIASNDSTAIVVLTDAKQSLGEEAKIAVSGGAVIITAGLDGLFGNSSSTALSETATAWLEKLATLLKAHPKLTVTIEGLTMTGEINTAATQANTISSLFQQEFGIGAQRIVTLGRDGNFKEGISFKLHPNYTEFYLMVKENMKNGS